MAQVHGEGVCAKLVGWEWGVHRDDGPSIVVVVIVYFCEFLEAEVTYAYHAVVSKSGTLDYIRGAA